MNDCPGLEGNILEGCRKKSLRHQEKLYKNYYGYVMAISLTYVSDRDIAREMTNDTFMKVFQNIDRYNDQYPFKAWLRKITVNTAIDYYRKYKKNDLHLEIEDTHTVAASHSCVDELTVQEIYKMIDTLPDALRIVFNLYEIEGYKHDEIARRLGISDSSSRTYLTRAKEKLRSLMKVKFFLKDGKSI